MDSLYPSDFEEDDDSMLLLLHLPIIFVISSESIFWIKSPTILTAFHEGKSYTAKGTGDFSIIKALLRFCSNTLDVEI